MRKGFTLIELLIVVAIIAILAAIAVPNFLEAQVRSKVSRQLTNMRTAATAIEAYTVDNNKIPVVTENAAGLGAVGTETCNFARKPDGSSWAAAERWKFYPGYVNKAAGLTTPVAYISGNDAVVNIFRLPHNFSSPLMNQIMYLPSNYYGTTTRTAQTNRYGAWLMRSAGPDTYYQNQFADRADYGAGPGGYNRSSYDPTNGTVSGGDIYRSQKRADDVHTGP